MKTMRLDKVRSSNHYIFPITLLSVILLGLYGYTDSGLENSKIPSHGPADLSLSFPSPIDGTSQPYRLYLPSAYDGTKSFPLLVALHGTGGNQDKYFDHPEYGNGIYKREAEKAGMVVLCPYGNDSLDRPTEWRGTGEIHVLTAINDVCQRFNIDKDRIVLTGQSMGGTGTTYLCCRYPHLFAAGIPLASTYNHLSLIVNLLHTPMLYVHGEEDWPIYAQTGPIPITDEMKRLGYNGTLWMIPNVGHNTMHVSTERVFAWALQQKRIAHPHHIRHRAYVPPHGRAWWVEISKIEHPGWFGEIDAQIEKDNRIIVTCRNTAEIILRPDAELLSLDRPIAIIINGQQVFYGTCSKYKQIRISKANDMWHSIIETRLELDPIHQLRTFPIGRIGDTAPTWKPSPETTFGNLVTDAMRDISGADIAIAPKGHYRYREHLRAEQPKPKQILYLIDLINWIRPLDGALALFTLQGKELLEILEQNIIDNPEEERFLVQVSGCKYKFNRSRPYGHRIIDTDISPDRYYRIVCNVLDIVRDDTLHLGRFFGKIEYQLLEPNVLSALWYYAIKNNGILESRLEGRVIDVKDESKEN